MIGKVLGLWTVTPCFTVHCGSSGIISGTHAEIRSLKKKYTEGWYYKAKRKATGLLNAVTSFEFIISHIGLSRFLNPLAGITHHLQVRGVGFTEAYEDV